MAGGMPGNVEYAQRQIQRWHIDLRVLLHWHKRLGDALARRAVNDGTAGRAQRWHAAGVIAVVVRD